MVGDQIQTFFTDLEGIMIAISASLAIIAFLGLAFMYMGSSLPFLARWKQNNPDAAQNVFIGLGILLLVSGGTVGGLVAF